MTPIIRMADVSEKVFSHLDSLGADEILLRSSQVEKIDTVARRIFGLDIPASGSGAHAQRDGSMPMRVFKYFACGISIRI